MRMPRQTGHSSSASSSDLSSSGRLHSSSFFLYNTKHLLCHYLDFTFYNMKQKFFWKMKQRFCWIIFLRFFSYCTVLMTLYSELFLSRSTISCLTSSTFSWWEAVTCSQVQYYRLVSTGTFSFLHNLPTSSISPMNEERKMVVLRSAHVSSSFQFLFYHLWIPPFLFLTFSTPFYSHHSFHKSLPSSPFYLALLSSTHGLHW